MFQFISGEQARLLVASGAQLVDVRNPHEYASGAAPGAKNIPLSVVPVRAHELDSSKPVVLYCVSGGRSAQAASVLQSLGFPEVHNVGSMSNFING
ncbi:MAG: rhodanese-like domain-containing protein [Gammaproteobacteria bacterium]|nr:rhodanese-like domain-containing protein [Gammaproteobacteria bacterium]